ncbi:MAG: DUF6510 family protein [Candidatus Dormiibacterota bacterium]
MDALDGNAIAGVLFEVFGREMTAASGRCQQCRTTAQVAELAVYAHSPGRVARCRGCGSVALVLVGIHGTTRLHTGCFTLDSEGPPSPAMAGPGTPP